MEMATTRPDCAAIFSADFRLGSSHAIAISVTMVGLDLISAEQGIREQE
jgi:hypothetical protein